jgi:hypothetical protein
MSASRWKSVLFTPLQVVLTLLLFAECAVILGAAAFPAVELWLAAEAALPLTGAPRVALLCVVAAAG